MSQTTISSSMQEVSDSLSELLDHTLSAGIDVLQSFSSAGAKLTSQFGPQLKTLNLPGLGGCCKIPPPCWVPSELSSVSSHVCSGATATLRFRITNCGMDARTITVEADQGADVNPVSLQLGPFKRGWVTVSFAVPPTSNNGDSVEILVFVRGCRSYYLRWTVLTSRRGCACCHEVDLDDCPELVHHWYDHFYCQRPCQPPRQVPGR